MEISIQELLPTATIAEVGKTEGDGGVTPVVSGEVFAEILQEYSVEHNAESELSTGESGPLGDVKVDVPLKGLHLVPLPEVSEPEDSEEDDHSASLVALETGQPEGHRHEVLALLAVPAERTLSGEVVHVGKLPDRAPGAGVKSPEEVGSLLTGAPANTQVVERVNEMVHAPGAHAHSPLIRVTVESTELHETIVPETVSETRETVPRVVEEAVRERPLLSKDEEAARAEASLRVQRETVSTRPTPGPVRAVVEEAVREVTGQVTAALLKASPKSEASTEEPSDGEKTVRLAVESETTQPSKAGLLAPESRSNVSTEAIRADTLPQVTTGSSVQATAPVSVLPVESVAEHVGARSAEQPTLPPPIRSTVSELGGAAIKGVRYLVSGGQESISIRIVPESLGEVHVSVKVVETGLEVELKSASATVRAAIEAQLPGLREALAREGIDVTRVTLAEPVGAGAPSGSFDRGAQGSDGASPSRPNASAYRNAEPGSGSALDRKRTTAHSGSLDLFV